MLAAILKSHAERPLPDLFCFALVVPFFAWDAMRLTHRVVGPLNRFRRAMREIAAGESVRLVRLREGDELDDMQRDFNAMLDQLQKRTEAMGQTKWPIEALTLSVLLLHQQEDRAGALAALERALSLAEAGRFIRVFVEKGDVMAMLLRQVREQYLAGNMGKHSQRLL